MIDSDCQEYTIGPLQVKHFAHAIRKLFTLHSNPKYERILPKEPGKYDVSIIYKDVNGDDPEVTVNGQVKETITLNEFRDVGIPMRFLKEIRFKCIRSTEIDTFQITTFTVMFGPTVIRINPD